MARHRTSRQERPTIVIPGSTTLSGRPVITAALMVGSMLALPGVVQPGIGESSPLEGSASIDPPEEVLRYDAEGRLTLEAEPGTISTVAGVALGPGPAIEVSPVVAEAVAETIRLQEETRPRSPLLAAMTFGPDDVETVKLDELGIVVGPSNSSARDPGDGTTGVPVLEVGGTEEAPEGTRAGEGDGPTLADPSEGERAAGETGSGAGGALLRGDDYLHGEAGGDTPTLPEPGDDAPDAPQGSGDSTPCPDTEELAGSGGTPSPEPGVGSGVEDPSEPAPTGTEDRGDVRPVPVVEVDEGPVTVDVVHIDPEPDVPDTSVDLGNTGADPGSDPDEIVVPALPDPADAVVDPVEEPPVVDVEPAPVVDLKDKDKPDKEETKDDHAGDDGGTDDCPDVGEDANETGQGQEASRGSRDDSEDEEKAEAGERESRPGAGDRADNSGPDSPEAGNPSGRGNAGDDAADSDDNGEGNN